MISLNIHACVWLLLFLFYKESEWELRERFSFFFGRKTNGCVPSAKHTKRRKERKKEFFLWNFNFPPLKKFFSFFLTGLRRRRWGTLKKLFFFQIMTSKQTQINPFVTQIAISFFLNNKNLFFHPFRPFCMRFCLSQLPHHFE
jgi:hypothetical protein